MLLCALSNARAVVILSLALPDPREVFRAGQDVLRARVPSAGPPQPRRHAARGARTGVLASTIVAHESPSEPSNSAGCHRPPAQTLAGAARHHVLRRSLPRRPARRAGSGGGLQNRGRRRRWPAGQGAAWRPGRRRLAARPSPSRVGRAPRRRRSPQLLAVPAYGLATATY